MTPSSYIVAVGCPRSGTKSLARLLDAQKAVCARHERAPFMPWDASDAEKERCAEWLRKGGQCLGHLRKPTVAEVNFALLPALDALRAAFGDALTVLCIQRDKDAWLDSVMGHLGDAIQTGGTVRSDQFPTYDEMDLVDAWSAYYDAYYEQEPPTITTDMLNSKEGQREILSLAGLSEEDARFVHLPFN